MAYTTQVTDNGIVHNVIHFSSKAQQIDDAVANMGGASTPQAALAALGAGVRPSELANTFEINQRGQTSYNNTGACFDCWKISNAGGSVVDNGDGTITISAQSQAIGVTQTAEKILSGDITFSALISSVSGDVTLYNQDTTQFQPVLYIPIKNAGIISGTFLSAEKQYRYGFRVGVGGIVTIPKKGVKVENGPTQTLAYQDSDGNWKLLPQPDSKYAAQLLECQRYQVYNSTSAYFRASYVSANAIGFNIPVPNTLRTNPVFDGSPNVQPINLSGAVSGFTFAYYTYPGYVRAVATKTGHGLSDAVLELPVGMFNSSL